MSDSKFDDKPRYLTREIGKSLFYRPYSGGLVSSKRTAEYLRFLGFSKRPIATHYNTLSIDRIRRNAGISPAPEGTPFLMRHFTVVSRFVKKKNLPLLISAYYRYRQLAGEHARELHVCGSGPDEANIRARIAELQVTGVIFHGFLQETEVAKVLGSSIALLLPSVEEQWGLVVNEAVAMGLPVICSDTVGARDDLIKSAVNGYAVESDNPEGFARFMLHLGQNEEDWRRMARNSLELAEHGDVIHFAKSVKTLIESERV